MRKNRFTEEQITMALRQADAGTAVAEICRRLGVSEASFYRWKKAVWQSGGVGAARVAAAAGREPEAEGVGGRSKPG